MIWLFRCLSSPPEATDLRTRFGNSSLAAPSIFAHLCPVNQLIGIGDADSGKGCLRLSRHPPTWASHQFCCGITAETLGNWRPVTPAGKMALKKVGNSRNRVRGCLARSAPEEGFVTLVPTILPVGVYTGSCDITQSNGKAARWCSAATSARIQSRPAALT
jgi:hypothetical protein